MPTTSVDDAIRRGTRLVQWPVWLLLAAPGPILVLSRWLLHIPAHNQRFYPSILSVFCLCFVAAWLWWSITVPKWRLWAYEHVDDIPELKRRALETRLTSADGSIFSRTEIKSAEHARRERELEQGA
jgi:hypothetical protein